MKHHCPAYFIFLFFLSLTAFSIGAKEAATDIEPCDGIVFTSWMDIVKHQGDTLHGFVKRPTRLYTIQALTFGKKDNTGRKAWAKVRDRAIALQFNDSLFVLSNFLIKRYGEYFANSNGDFILPLYITDKIAFYEDCESRERNIDALGASLLFGVLGGTVFASVRNGMVNERSAREKSTVFEILDIVKHKTIRIDQDNLTELLYSYPQLQAEYKALDKKTRNDWKTLRDFFLRYVDALDADPNVPAIFRRD